MGKKSTPTRNNVNSFGGPINISYNVIVAYQSICTSLRQISPRSVKCVTTADENLETSEANSLNDIAIKTLQSRSVLCYYQATTTKTLDTATNHINYSQSTTQSPVICLPHTYWWSKETIRL